MTTLCYTVSWSQSSTLTSGSTAVGNDGSASFSIGQPIIHSISDGSSSVSFGVQQPYEISQITGTDDLDLSNIIHIFPNPVSDNLTIKIDAEHGQNQILTAKIIDVHGKQISTFTLDQETQTIESNSWPQGVYFIQIFNTQNQSRTYKIIKK